MVYAAVPAREKWLAKYTSLARMRASCNRLLVHHNDKQGVADEASQPCDAAMSSAWRAGLTYRAWAGRR